jgi:glutamate/tyrosine decarboxylase-like PLP-dependent enzyme
VLCFRYIPRTYLINSEESINNFNTLLRQKLLHDGDYYLSGTEIEKKSCFRTVIMNLPTKEQHIEKLIAKLHLLSNEIIEDIRKESEKNMKHSDI